MKSTIIKIHLVAAAMVLSGSALATQSPNMQLADTTTVVTTVQPTDTSITTDIKERFLKEKVFGDADIAAFTIHVETKDGVVFLTGTADNTAQADNAMAIVKAVPGVKSVNSQVQIKQ